YEVHKAVYGPAGRFPYLRTCGLVMGYPVALLMELVGTEGASLLCKAFRLSTDKFQIAARYLSWDRARQLIDQDHLCSESTHHPRTLFGIAPGHHGNERVTPYTANDGQPRSHISRCKFEHGLPRAQRALLLCRFDDAASGAILLRESGIKIIELCQDRTFYTVGSRKAIQPNQRRVPDSFNGGLQNLGHKCLVSVCTRLEILQPFARRADGK